MIIAHLEGFHIPTTSVQDNDDDSNDEHPGENEASSREADDQTEAPEEFQGDYQKVLSQPEDDAEEEEAG
jgi:hypothetical protein